MKKEDVEKYGIQAQGKQELIDFLEGKELTKNQCIKAKCYECNNGYTDGRNDCVIFDCPLYGYSPYSSHKFAKRKMTEEQVQRSRQNLSKARDNKL
jgi:hypothetical protein